LSLACAAGFSPGELLLIWFLRLRLVDLRGRCTFGGCLFPFLVSGRFFFRLWRRQFVISVSRVRRRRQFFLARSVFFRRFRVLWFLKARAGVDDEIAGPKKRVVGGRRVAGFFGVFKSRLVGLIERVL